MLWYDIYMFKYKDRTLKMEQKQNSAQISIIFHANS